MTFIQLLEAVASVATAIGIGIAAFQLWQVHLQARTTFEDNLVGEYRVLAAKLPIRALFGEPLSKTDLEEHLGEFYQYIDLTNGQIFFRQKGRVSLATWQFWCDGIRSNMKRPAFSSAWDEISRRAPGDFTEMRRLIAESYMIDPHGWR